MYEVKPMPLPADYLQDARINLGLRPFLLVVLLGALIAVFLLSLTMGSVNIPLDQIVIVLLGGEAEKFAWNNIVLKFRFPKAATAALAGAALGASGLMMQTYFRNPLAGPFVLGISSGASLGVAIIVFSAGTTFGATLAAIGLRGDLMVAGAAAIGAGATMMIVLLAAARVQSGMSLLILGLMMGYLVSALVSLMLYFANAERLQAYVNWTFGSFSNVTQDQLPILFWGIFAGLFVAVGMTKSLNALLLGEGYARSLGMNVGLTRLAIIGTTAILAGMVTAFCGPIGFVGVAVPHLTRSLFNTSDHRVLMPASILTGAIFALVATILAGAPGSNLVFPLNAVTAFIGAPVVMLVIMRQRNIQRTFAS